jgi:DnaJ-class molecular chaperone
MVRRGCDLFSPLVVPLYDALLGGSLLVTTIRGQRLLTVPPGEWSVVSRVTQSVPSV